MRHPKDVGDESTLMIMLALRRTGHAVFVPFGENTRYDLITDNGARLSRVQCKTGRLRAGAIRFPTCSSYAHHPNPKQRTRTYEGEIDEFAVYCPELGTVYLLSIDDVPNRCVALLRVEPAKNNQRTRVRLAAAYEIARLEID